MNVIERLKNMMERGNIPHALLFVGPPQSEKKDVAHQFARTLVKTTKAIDNHPDIHLYFPEGKVGLHPIESIRSLAQDVALAPFEAEKKVFILHEADKMLPTSSNALLKTLEEPSKHTHLILISDHPDRLLPTVVSRCQLFVFAGKPQIDSAILPFLSGESPRSSLNQLESETPDALFETILFWYRDRLLLEINGPEEQLYFPTHVTQLKQTAFIPLERVEKQVSLARLAHARSTKLSTCLEMLFLALDQTH